MRAAIFDWSRVTLACGLTAAVFLIPPLALNSAEVSPTPSVRHVLVVGVDGLGSEGVRRARTPHLDRLMKSGASTLAAQGIMPSSSSPNWASMIMGAGPDRHGVTSNDWQPDKYDIPPAAVGSGGIFPTIFGVLREQRPSSTIAVFHDWKDFRRLLETNAPNVLVHVKDAIETAAEAMRYFKKEKPELLFIHFDGVDHAGHGFGWRSKQYDLEVAMVDGLIGAIVDTVKTIGLSDSTVILVTADHGGTGTSHGGASKAEREIPWIAAGPGIAAGRRIKGEVNTYDTAPTIAYLLGLKAPACWIGKPVMEAMESRARR